MYIEKFYRDSSRYRIGYDRIIRDDHPGIADINKEIREFNWLIEECCCNRGFCDFEDDKEKPELINALTIVKQLLDNDRTANVVLVLESFDTFCEIYKDIEKAGLKIASVRQEYQKTLCLVIDFYNISLFDD